MPDALSPGTRLGPYEILASIGAGGMGEVYRARDTRLDRSVAVKVLPREFASDPDRRARFEREARVVAGLSHPNVCAVHDVGVTSLKSGDDLSYLVMEHLDGETLDRRIARGALSAGETIRVAAEITRGLDAAHRQRIVHRDLKPSNIMLTRTGVKLLDFGLAKALESGHAGSSLGATTATSPGTVLGTVPYMAPEQIEAKPVDARADIFALGAVIYEMASGRRAFGGDSPAAVASAILSSEPPPVEPRELDRIVRECLRKDADQRWQSAHDVALQLEALRESGTRNELNRPDAAHRTRWPWIIAAASLALAVIAGLAAWSRSGERTVDTSRSTPVIALTVTPPPASRFSTFVEYSFVSVSPDGSSVAYVVQPRSGPPAVWLRKLASTEARPIPGTEHAISTFWSPDSQSLAFFADGKLKRVDLSGGAPVTICSVPIGVGLIGTWGATGEILYAAVGGQNIMRVSSRGGEPQTALAPDPSKNEARVAIPSFLPDGRRFLYLAGGAADHRGKIMLGNLDGGAPIEVLHQQSMAQYVEPGFLVFVQDSALVGRRFDAATGRVSGTPISIAPRVNWLHSTGIAQFSASSSGVIAFLPHLDEGRIASFARTGAELAEIRPPGSYQFLRVSADGKQMLLDFFDPSVSSFDVWLHDLERGSDERVTSHLGSDVSATWIPGGGFLYAASRGAAPRLHQQRTVTSPEVPLFDGPGNMQIMPDISADGKWVVFSERGARGAFQVMWMDMQERRPQRLHPAIDAPETGARFSPDGTLLTYVSDVTGRREVYIEPFRSPADRKTVSVGGGLLPRWSRNGAELFYMTPAGQLQVVRVSSNPLTVSKPVTLFENKGPHPWIDYDVSADGRFFANVPLTVAAEQPFTVLVNWPSLVKQ